METPSESAAPTREHYERGYFERYDMRNALGQPIGERRYFYDFWVKELARHLEPGARVLEVGCGPGFFLQHLTGRYAAVAFDLSRDALARARERSGCRALFQADAGDMPLADGELDAIVAFDLVEHLETPERFFEQARALLRPGGLLVVATPNPESLGCRVKQGREAGHERPWEERMAQWHGWRDETHINIRPIEDWRALLRESRFEVLRDGTDFWWDTPYFSGVPVLLQKLAFNGPNRILTRLFGFLPWKRGENYYAVARSGC